MKIKKKKKKKNLAILELKQRLKSVCQTPTNFGSEFLKSPKYDTNSLPEREKEFN
jgi:hypothetical protein